MIEEALAPASKPTAVVACVAAGRRSRLLAALGPAASITWLPSFAELAVFVATDRSVSVVILDATDEQGQTASSVAPDIVRASPAVSVILYATHQEILGGAIASPAITDLIVVGETDGKIFVQGVVLDAVKRRAADRVVAALKSRMSESLLSFAEFAVRNPSYNTVEALADYIGVHRQTAAVWCRKERFLRPEELLMWCRLLLVAAILERTNYTVTSLATDLDFPSVIALRNQLKRYTGLTGLEIRSKGFEWVLNRFDEQVANARARRESTNEVSLAR